MPAREPLRGAAALRASPDGTAERVRRALDDHAQVARLSRTFRALGDPTRSRVVYALSLGELCVSDLAHALGGSLSATSHQLRILRDLEIVRVRRQGRSQLYALNERAFGFCAPSVCRAWRQTLEIETAGHARRRARAGSSTGSTAAPRDRGRPRLRHPGPNRAGR
jgi:ArsR family transcriptional regulator, lead/cadmium/zinc/bismuth-responsive transcriptional repressor